MEDYKSIAKALYDVKEKEMVFLTLRRYSTNFKTRKIAAIWYSLEKGLAGLAIDYRESHHLSFEEIEMIEKINTQLLKQFSVLVKSNV
jgi:hypothetical protein